MNIKWILTLFITLMQSVSHNVTGEAGPYYNLVHCTIATNFLARPRWIASEIFWLKKSGIYGYLNCKKHSLFHNCWEYSPSSLPSLLILRRYFTRIKLFNNFRLSLFLSLHYAKLDPSPDIQRGAVKLPKFMTTCLIFRPYFWLWQELKVSQCLSVQGFYPRLIFRPYFWLW